MRIDIPIRILDLAEFKAFMEATKKRIAALERERASGIWMSDERPHLIVHTDHNPDEVRSFYEIPDAIARRVQPEGDKRTFAQALADLLLRGPAG